MGPAPAYNETMGDAETTVVKVLRGIADVDATGWDACANPDPATFNPFVAHAFLKALEDSGCVCARTGWQPQHLAVDGADGSQAAVMPLYVKSHSQGEYVFDQGWAEAYGRAGGRYYPKLQCAVPFTPVPGPRLLVRPGPGAQAGEAVLASAAIRLAEQMNASSLHVTFLDEAAWSRLAQLGFLGRRDQQFHWINRGYTCFDDFLARLASRKRKGVRKEREQALAGGIEIEHVTGPAIKEAHWDAMFAFYMVTGSRKWGRPYLNRAFFSLLGEAMAGRCLIVLARRGARYVAGALHLIGGDCLYGRYWGTSVPQPCLHFELCYYQAIDTCIAKGLARAEAGAQGEHKLARGFEPVPTYSSHWIRDPAFRRAVAAYLEREGRALDAAMADLREAGPYRKAE